MRNSVIAKENISNRIRFLVNELIWMNFDWFWKLIWWIESLFWQKFLMHLSSYYLLKVKLLAVEFFKKFCFIFHGRYMYMYDRTFAILSLIWLFWVMAESYFEIDDNHIFSLLFKYERTSFFSSPLKYFKYFRSRHFGQWSLGTRRPIISQPCDKCDTVITDIHVWQVCLTA